MSCYEGYSVNTIVAIFNFFPYSYCSMIILLQITQIGIHTHNRAKSQNCSWIRTGSLHCALRIDRVHPNSDLSSTHASHFNSFTLKLYACMGTDNQKLSTNKYSQLFYLFSDFNAKSNPQLIVWAAFVINQSSQIINPYEPITLSSNCAWNMHLIIYTHFSVMCICACVSETFTARQMNLGIWILACRGNFAPHPP